MTRKELHKALMAALHDDAENIRLTKEHGVFRMPELFIGRERLGRNGQVTLTIQYYSRCCDDTEATCESILRRAEN